MVGRLRRFGLIAAAALAGLAAGPAPAPAPVPRVVAIGDLHGDFTVWRDIASAAGLIDAGGHWIGGKTVLVQTGDVPDRGPDTRKIIDDLMRLQREAARAGGRVVAMVGNHEAMNLTDDLRYVTPGEYAAFADRDSEALRQRTFNAKQAQIAAAYRQRDPAMTPDAVKAAWLAATPLGLLEHQTAWRPTGRIGRWVIGNPAVVLIDGTLFVHGGLAPAYAKLPLAEINARIAASLKAREIAPEAIINDQTGPLWYRGLAVPAPNAPPVAAELQALLAAQGAQRIVIAHTPILSGIAVLEGGKLIRIDTGNAAYYRGTPSYLEIVGGTLVPHAVARSTPLPEAKP